MNNDVTQILYYEMSLGYLCLTKTGSKIWVGNHLDIPELVYKTWRKSLKPLSNEAIHKDLGIESRHNPEVA